MADLKISQLTDGGNSQATDEYVVARSGANYRIDGASVAAAATSVGTLTSLTVSGDLTVDTSTLKVDSTNNRVGIGTASPSTGLHVAGSSVTPATVTISNSTAGTSGSPQLTRLAFIGFNGEDRGRIESTDIAGSGNGSQLRFYTANTSNVLTQQAVIDASGNLGLGVTPTYKLDVAGSTIRLANSSAGNTQIVIVANGQTAGVSSFDIINDASNAYLYNRANTPLIFGTNGTERARIDASGNLGLGTTPVGSNRYLEVGPTSATQNYIRMNAASNGFALSEYLASGTAAAFVGINASASKVGSITAGTFGIGTPDSYALTFATGNTERARITSGGYFKASDTGTYGSSTGSFHELRSSAADNAAKIASTHASTPYGLDISYTAAAPNGTSNQFIYCADNAALRATIRSNGGLANYQANDVNLSDERVKTDIAPVGSYWDKLKAIEIVTFKYIDQTHDDDNIGVIAQQVEAVAPEFVDVNGFGETPEGEDPLKTIYTTDLYHASIKALQEAMARIEALEVEVAALKGGA